MYKIIKVNSLRFLAAILFCCALLAGVTDPVWASSYRSAGEFAEVTVLDPEKDTVDGNYEFSARILKDEEGGQITRFVPFGEWDNQEHDQISSDPNDGQVIARITDESKKGNLGAWFYNVGTYQGKTVDVRCTVVDYDQYDSAEGDTDGVGWIIMKPYCIGIYHSWMLQVDMRIDYFDAETGEPVQVKGYATMADVDAMQGMQILSPYDSLAVDTSCTLQATEYDGGILFCEKEGKYAENDEEDTWAHVQAQFDSDYFAFRFFCTEFFKEGFWEEQARYYIDPDEFEGWDSYWASKGKEKKFGMEKQAYTSYRLAQITIPEPGKLASDGDETLVNRHTLKSRQEEYSYTISHNVPKEREKWYYDSYMIEDRLDPLLEYRSAQVLNDAGDEVTDLFYIKEEGGLITFEVKESKNPQFYGENYHYVINTAVKADADLEPYWQGEAYEVSNIGHVTVKRGDLETALDTEPVKTIIVDEYVDNKVEINKTDARSGRILDQAEFTLYEWQQSKEAYIEVGLIPFSEENQKYEYEGLKKTRENQGKYRIAETKVPQWYTGEWSRELVVTKDKEVFAFDAENEPVGSETIKKTAVVLHEDGSKSEETGKTETPVPVIRSDKIQYHIYVERSCAPGYKSGEILLTDKIPVGAVYQADKLNLLGEILNPAEDSKAKITGVHVDDEGLITWKITGLDQGESAHVLFEVSMPETAVLLKNKAKISDAQDKTELESEELEHQLSAPVLTIEKVADPKDGSEVKEKEEITYYVKVNNTGDASAKNVIIRDFIPEGTTYVKDSLKCSGKDAELHMATAEEKKEKVCKMVYALIPELEASQTAVFSFQVRVNPAEEERTISNIAQIREVREKEVDPEEAAVSKEGYADSNEIRHHVKPEKKAIVTPTEEPTATPTVTPTAKAEEKVPEKKPETKVPEKKSAAAPTVKTTSAATVKTGDSAQILLFAGLGIGALGVMAFAGIRLFRKKSIKRHKTT